VVVKPQEVIAELYAAGGRIDLNLDRPALLVPARVRPRIEPYQHLLRASVDLPEVVRRAAIFRERITLWFRSGRIGVPVVTLSEALHATVGSCISCGAALAQGNWRCPTCTAALYEALRPTAETTS